MHAFKVWKKFYLLSVLWGFLAPATWAQPTIRLPKSYEDTVRILILYNSTAVGWNWCAPGTIPVGQLTSDFTVKSLTGIPNVKVLKAEETQWSDVQSAFPGGKLPHVIVHVNAGWYDKSGPYIGDVLNRAADQAIGVVSIGDDAAHFAETVFGFTNVNNVPTPMGDATQYKASNTNLWLDLNGKADTLPSPGVIRNTVDSLRASRLFFKPFGTDASGDYRCQEDADKYTVTPSYLDRLNFLGFQRAFDGKDTIAAPTELQTIVAFQDLQRRGVALSFQPQFLQDAKSASQIVYDAILYASYAHFYYSTVSTPFATPGSTAFNSQLSVNLSTATPGAVIHYTLDGKTPDSTSLIYSSPIVIQGTTTIKAIAYKPGWLPSGIMTEVYTKNFVPSTLDIFDQNGNPLSGGYLTELNSSYTVRIATTQAGLASLTANASTKSGGDQEAVALNNPQAQGDFWVYTGAAPLIIGPATANNGKTEAATYDSLIVRWANPVDPKDVAEKHVLIRPAPKQAQAYFSAVADGSAPTDRFVGNETTIYLFVTDEVLPPGVTPTVTIETTPKLGSGRTADKETFTLEAVAPGKYRAAIPIDLNPSSVAGDHKLQISLEDQIKGTYSDPMDAEPPAVANAGFGVAPEIDASLQFTDKDGNVLPAGYYYSPAEGALYLTYKDDWITGGIATESVAITIVNQRNASPDTETFNLNLSPADRSGGTGVWKGSLTLKDGPSVTPRNGIAETYILGTVTAKAVSHDKTGAAASPVTATLLVAYGNQDAVLSVQGRGGPGAQINRDDSVIHVTLNDQSVSSGKDTVFAQVSCTGSKDALNDVMLIEDSAGHYVSGDIRKAEGAKAADNILQCLSTDQIKVTYTDPVYNDTKEVRADINNPVATRLYFTAGEASAPEIKSISENDAKSFYIQILAHNQNAAVVDTLHVTVTTANGDTETFIATETGPNTDLFRAAVPFGFVTAAATPQNGALEGKILPAVANNHVSATATIAVDGAPASADIELIAAFDPVVKAYIKDANGDGAADQVYIVFAKKLARLPSTLDAQWNDGSPASTKTVGAAKLSFLNSDSTIIVADFGVSPFKQGLTSADAANPPRATLPGDDALFAGQKPILEDSIGPVLVSVIKKPANVNALVPNDPNFNLDTLIVTVSEPLKASQDFKDILKFATSCNDYSHALTIEAVKDPATTDATVYTVIVDNSAGKSPQTGNCVFLNADPGKFTDLAGNQPPQLGVLLDGADRARIIQLFRGYPPVAGLDPNQPNFQVAVEDTRDPNSGYATPVGNAGQWQVLWIPPAGYVEGQPYHPYTIHSFDDLPGGARETATPVRLPDNISTIQIVSTTAYIARIAIFDIYGNFVRSMTQVFGGAGELQNLSRVVPKGLVSYLVWDMKDRHGQLAGQGVYVWKVQFEFKGGKQEVQYTRTGLLRQR